SIVASGEGMMERATLIEAIHHSKTIRTRKPTREAATTHGPGSPSGRRTAFDLGGAWVIRAAPSWPEREAPRADRGRSAPGTRFRAMADRRSPGAIGCRIRPAAHRRLLPLRA